MAEQTFRFPGRPSVVVLATAAASAVVGIALLMASLLFSWPVFVVAFGVFGVVDSLVLLGVSLFSASRQGLTAVVGDDGVALTAGGRTTTQGWASMRAVTMGPNSLTLKRTDADDLTIVVPPGSDSRQMDALAHALAQRLDADRGYRNF